MTIFSRDSSLRAEQVQAHLGDHVADYVDGMLSPAEEYRADIHLMVCEHCRFAVQQERAIIEQLRSVSFDRGGHEQLMAGLLSLASSQPGAPMGGAAASGRVAARPAPAVVTSSAPPQYQSARKSMACALFAVAGCVGVALVASTASGAVQGPQSPAGQAPGRGAALVRNVSSPVVTDSVQPETAGGAQGIMEPTFVQLAGRTP
ncbi:zf-HC2 domain-containing protein [Flexivirga caeni]|uniref:Putative zinc-finger domain-containing protein n=1 Tax=Flexivirga caeni TaxID=2294115 RepID=A0A3M9M1M2_9MICO|nr:zf-HC2 domain-containing protein [Flexivirga caeni]RNI19461.1 hypothetical protein EFY87_16620 [Flexivirga caeni]